MLGFRFDLLFGQFFVVELNDFLDRARSVAQILAHLQQFLQNQRRPRDRLQHQQLSAFNALGDGHFAFARQQRHRAHLAQIHAHWIVGLLERPRSQIQFAIFRSSRFRVFRRLRGIAGIRRGQRHFRARQVFIHINPIALKRREQIVNFFRGVHLGRQNIVHLIVEQVTAFLAHGDELPYLIVFFL